MCFALKFQCLHLLGMGQMKLVAPVPREEEWEERVTTGLCLWLQPGRPGGVIQKRDPAEWIGLRFGDNVELQQDFGGGACS